MSHGLKALLIAASTIITCIIVGLGFSMAREAKQIGNYVVEEMHSYRVSVEEQDYTKYDGVTVYGNDVVNLMKYVFSVKEANISITVEENGERRIYEVQEDIKRRRKSVTDIIFHLWLNIQVKWDETRMM